MRRLIRTLPSLCAVIVGAASFALSYVALRDVAAHLHAVPAYLAFLVPVVVDGGIIAGSAIIWETSYSARRRQVFPYIFVGILVVMSVTMNVAHAGSSPLAKVIAALPPLVLLGAIELVAGQHMRDAKGSSSATADAPEPAARPAPAAAVEQPPTPVTAEPAPPPVGLAPVVTVVGTPSAGSGSITVPATQPAAAAPHTAPARQQRTSASDASAPAPERLPEQATTQPAPQTPAQAGASHATALPPLGSPEPDRRSSTTRRPLRTRAAGPDDEPPPVVAEVLRLPTLTSVDNNLPAADRVRRLFEEYVTAGGSAEHPQLANSIAAQLDLTPSYVRKLIRPLREATPAI